MSEINRLKNMSKAGQRQQALANHARNPGSIVRQESSCFIKRMFDPTEVSNEQDEYILSKVGSGYLFVEVVELGTEKSYILPLAHDAGFVYFNYGNGKQIAGMAAKILYVGSDKTNGYVEIVGNPNESYGDQEEIGVTYDIGYFFGA
jgi:hypothetical protein